MKIILLFTTLITFNTALGNVSKIDTIVITDSSIIIDQTVVLSFPLSVDSLERILGESRKSKPKSERRTNDIYFWDKLGIMVFCPRNTRNITSFDVCYRKSFWYETRRLFKGVLIINNHQIDKNANREDLGEVGFVSSTIQPEPIDEYGSLEFSEFRITAEFKENGGKLIGIGISMRNSW